jgi:hypothetical protein
MVISLDKLCIMYCLIDINCQAITHVKLLLLGFSRMPECQGWS